MDGVTIPIRVQMPTEGIEAWKGNQVDDFPEDEDRLNGKKDRGPTLGAMEVRRRNRQQGIPLLW